MARAEVGPEERLWDEIVKLHIDEYIVYANFNKLILLKNDEIIHSLCLSEYYLWDREILYINNKIYILFYYEQIHIVEYYIEQDELIQGRTFIDIGDTIKHKRRLGRYHFPIVDTDGMNGFIIGDCINYIDSIKRIYTNGHFITIIDDELNISNLSEEFLSELNRLYNKNPRDLYFDIKTIVQWNIFGRGLVPETSNIEFDTYHHLLHIFYENTLTALKFSD